MILMSLYLLLWILYGAAANSDLSKESNCSCYMFFAWKQKSWNLAQKQCVHNQGNLVSIETHREWEFVNAKIQTRNFSKNEWWIGLRKESGKWLWRSGESLMIHKWQTAVGEPNDDGDCAAMAKNYPAGTQGLFKDMKCDVQRNFICEYESRKAICKTVGSEYFNCPSNDSQHHEVSKPVYVNHTATRILPTVVKLSNATTPPLIPSRIGLLVFVVIFGFVLLVCTLSFIYVFCWCVYNPGYEGQGREDQEKLYTRQTSLSDSASMSTMSTNKSPRAQWYITDNRHTESIELVEQQWSASPNDGITEEPENSMQITAQTSEKYHDLEGKPPIVYVEVHNSSSTTRLLEEDGVVVGEGHEAANNNNESQNVADNNAVVYSDLQDIRTSSSNQTRPEKPVPYTRHRSKTVLTTISIGGNGVAKETCATSSRSQTWGAKSRDHTIDDRSNATWYTTDEEKPVTHVNPGQTSGNPNVIYATVDKSKKTKRQTNDRDNN